MGPSKYSSFYEMMISEEDSADESNFEIIAEGRVTDDLGQPLSDVTVYLRFVGSSEVVERQLKTDADGRFSTRVPPRLVVLVVSILNNLKSVAVRNKVLQPLR